MIERRFEGLLVAFSCLHVKLLRTNSQGRSKKPEICALEAR
jgi:hypothetical protein